MVDDGSNHAAVQAYYARDQERDRLAADLGRVEFERTIEIVSRTLPDPPAIVADIGGGPGRYTDWLVDSGYSVVHRDVVPDHVEQVRRRHGGGSADPAGPAGPAGPVDAAVGDARALDLADDSVDAVLLLGPLYHLEHEHERVAALREAARVVRPGGHVYAAAISRWASRLHGMLMRRTHEVFPAVLDQIDEMERTGWMAPLFEGSFTGYAHRPDQLVAEVESAGLHLEQLVSVEGIATMLAGLDDRLDDPGERRLLLDTLRATESVPELLGAGPHLLAVTRAS